MFDCFQIFLGILYNYYTFIFKHIGEMFYALHIKNNI